MKYLNKITLGLILCMGFVSSCKDDDEAGINGISVDKEEITIGAEGGTERIPSRLMINGWHVYLILILGLPFHRQMVWVRQIVFLP